MFIRRVFYDRDTLAILHQYMMQGDIFVEFTETVAAHEGLTNWALFEWTEPDPEIEASFTSHNTVTVEMRDGAPTLVFGNTEEPEIEDEHADMRAALELLGVTPEED